MVLSPLDQLGGLTMSERWEPGVPPRRWGGAPACYTLPTRSILRADEAYSRRLS